MVGETAARWRSWVGISTGGVSPRGRTTLREIALLGGGFLSPQFFHALRGAKMYSPGHSSAASMTASSGPQR